MADEEMSFPPQDVRGDNTFNDVELARAVLRKAQPYFTEWMSQAHLAVSAFKNAAEQHIEDLDVGGDAEADWADVVWAFASAMCTYVPGVNQGMATMGQVADVGSKIISAMGYDHLSEDGAKAMLRKAVRNLADKSYEAITSAREAAEGDDSPLVEMISDKLTWVEWGSLDDDYVRSLVEWLFEYPNAENTYEPIRQALENEFAGLYFRVKGQLIRDSPRYPGTDGIYPPDWEREAERDQQKDFEQEGREGWDNIYENE